MTEKGNKAHKPVFPRLLRRIRASLIDSVIYTLIVVLWWIALPYLQVLPGSARIALPVMLWLILDPLLVSATGGTLGHHLMNIKIVDTRSLHHIGLFRALCRSFLRTLLGWLSLIFILVTKKHQALHDLVVRSTVVLADPEKVPSSEQRTEQLPDQNYNHPAIWRRTLFIVLYLLFWLFAMGIASNSILSTDCLVNSRCSNSEKTVQIVMSTIIIVVAAVIFVCGCRGLLPGARRRPIN